MGAMDRLPALDFGGLTQVPTSGIWHHTGTETLEILPEDVELGEGNLSTHEKIFVGSDFHSGPLDVIHAEADGKHAAETIDESLMGEKRIRRLVRIETVDDTDRPRPLDNRTRRHVYLD